MNCQHSIYQTSTQAYSFFYIIIIITLLLLLLFTDIEFTPGGSSPYTSDK